MNAADDNPASAYFILDVNKRMVQHTLAVVVDNEPGVLARVIGLFSGRGYNIDTLTVSQMAHVPRLSRITIVTTGTAMAIDQIRHQLERLVPVHRVEDLTAQAIKAGDEKPLERELALVKIICSGEQRMEALRLAEALRATVIDATSSHFVFEITGRSRKVTQFLELMVPLGLVESTRTGIAAMHRGKAGIQASG